MTRRNTVFALLIAVLTVTGCSGTGTADALSPDDLTPVTVATSPSLVGIPIRIAHEKGFFKDEGLDVELVTATSPAQQAPLLLNGDVPFSYSGVHDTLLAAGQGLPFKLVVPMAIAAPAGETKPGFGNLIVAADSDIQTPADLEGRTVSVTSIGGTSHMDYMTKLEGLGVDSGRVNWVETPVQRSLDSLRQGQVDAATSSEPFGTMAVEAGEARFLFSADDVIPSVAYLGLITSQDYAEQHPDVVRAMANAVLRANQYALDHPDEVQEIAAQSYEISPDLAAKVTYPAYATRLFTVEDVLPRMEQIARSDAEANLPDASAILLNDSIFAGLEQ